MPTATSRKPETQNPIASMIAMVLKTIGTLVLSVVLGVVIELLGMGHTWEPHVGTRLTERTAIEHRLLLTQVGPHPMRTFDQLHSVYLSWLDSMADFHDSRKLRSPARASRQSSNRTPLAKSVAKVALTLDYYAAIAVEFVRATTFRLTALSVGIAVAAILATVGLVDGLVRRDVRRWSGGRESSWVYNASRRLIGPVVFAYSVVLVVWPWVLHIGWIIATFSSIFTVLLSIAGYRFKKYL